MQRSGRSFFLVFLLPLLAVMVISMGASISVLFNLKQEYSASLAHQRQDLSALAEIGQIGEGMAVLQQEVLEVLKLAQHGQLDEGLLYRIHSKVVDRLAEMSERSHVFAESLASQHGAQGEISNLVTAFENYRNYVMMATDIAAIDPSTSGRYIALARDRYFDFSFSANRLSMQMREHATGSAEYAAQHFDNTFHGILAAVLIGLLFMLGFAYLSAHILARRIAVLTVALDELAHTRGEPAPLPLIEDLQHRESGVFADVAAAVLSFRQALVDRHQADRALLGHQAHLENMVESRTVELSDARDRAEATSRYARSLIEASQDPLVVIDIEGRVSDVNSAMERIIGREREALKAGFFADLFVDPERARGGCDSVYVSGAIHDLELHLRRSDGNVAEVLCNASQYHDAAGNVLGVVATVHDISELRQTEQKLRIAAVTFETQQGIVITDANGIMIRANNAFTEITGYAAEEVIGQTTHLLSSGKHDDDFYAEMWQSIRTKGSWAGEIWNRRKSGEVYPEHLTITAVRDEAGDIQNYVGAFIDITSSKAASEEIKQLAFYDPLTHLPNRRLLLDRLFRAIVSAHRNGKRGALLFIDLDHFKWLNDTLGHDAGDLLLQQVAMRLTDSVRDGDTVARLGGDEFVVMLEDLSSQPLDAVAQAEMISEKILASLNIPYALGEHEHRSTPSIGATLFGDQGDTVEDILKQADTAMYQSKAAGRNMIRFFVPDMQNAINARVELENALREAISRHQFELNYQIQVNSTGKMVGAEALIRWRHPECGVVLPREFITVLEETGMIVAVGNWVLDAACAQIRIWQNNEMTRDWCWR